MKAGKVYRMRKKKRQGLKEKINVLPILDSSVLVILAVITKPQTLEKIEAAADVLLNFRSDAA